MSEEVVGFLMAACGFLLAEIPHVNVPPVPARCEDGRGVRTPLGFHDAPFLAVNRREGSGQVPQIPDRGSFVRRPTQKQELVERREVQTVDLVSVGHDLKQRFLLSLAARSIPLIPQHQKPIV